MGQQLIEMGPFFISCHPSIHNIYTHEPESISWIREHPASAYKIQFKLIRKKNQHIESIQPSRRKCHFRDARECRCRRTSRDHNGYEKLEGVCSHRGYTISMGRNGSQRFDDLFSQSYGFVVLLKFLLHLWIHQREFI